MAEVNVTTKEDFVSPSSGTSQMFNSLVWVAPVLLLVVTVVVQRLVSGSKEGKLKLPPIPNIGMPVVGAMFKIRSPQTHRMLVDLAKKYGSLFALKTGITYFVVITSADVAYEALITKYEAFSTRPKLLSRLNYTGFRSVNSALYDKYWRDVRKNMVTQALSSARVASFRPLREKELNNLIGRIRADALQNDNVVPVLSNVRFTVFSILLHICFRCEFEASVVKDLDYILRRILILLFPQIVDFLPFVQFFNRSHKNECQELLGRLRTIFTPYINEHREMRKNGKPAGDYLDSLIVLQEQMDLKETDILTLLGEIITAATDTTSNVIEWTMAYLVEYPEMQARLYEEIKSVCGDRTVEDEDVEKMPYLHALVKEDLRKNPPLPFSLPHGVTGQTKFRGYDIPASSTVIFHVQAMQNDPEHWDQPEKFIPERFLTATPNPDHDMTGSHGPRSFDLIPFGAGRRICPGMSLALKHAHLIISRLVQTFEWTTPNPGEGVDFSDHLAFTVVMSTPLQARIRERSNA